MTDPAPATCPSWCARIHGEVHGEDDMVHISEQSAAGNMFLRLATTIDPDTGHQDGPYVLVGSNEYTLDQAEAVATALSDLVRTGRADTAAGDPAAGDPAGDTAVKMPGQADARRRSSSVHHGERV